MVNLSYLSQSVFRLKQEEKIILQYLSEKPLNAYQICNKTEKYGKVNLRRTGVMNWLNGTQSRPGLIGLDFVTKKIVKTPKNKKDQATYHLTTKGMMACLTKVNPIERIYLFDRYCKFICERIDDFNLFGIVKNFIKSQIEVFLLWHYIHGINLHELISSQSYFERFFEHVDSDFYKQFQKYGKLIPKASKSILENHNISSNTLYFLDMIANPENTKYLKLMGLDKDLSKQVYEKMKYNALYVQHWYQYMEVFQDVDWKSLSYVLKSPKFLQINSEKTKNKTQTILIKLGYDDQFIESAFHVMESKKVKGLELTKNLKISKELFENV